MLEALDSYVREGLAGFEGTGQVKRVQVGDDSSGAISFNTPKAASSSVVFPDDAPDSARQFFSARYDGDAEAFVRAERAAGGLDLEADDIVAGVDAPLVVPTGLASADDASWRASVDPVRAWLAERFDTYPQVTVAPAEDIERGWDDDSPFRLGVYPASYGGAAQSNGSEGLGSGATTDAALEAMSGTLSDTGTDELPAPLVDNWVTFGEESELRLESNEAGVFITEDGLVARRLDAQKVDLAALMDDSSWTLADVTDVYAVSLAGDTLAQATAVGKAAKETGAPSPMVDLRLSLLVPGSNYDSAAGEQGSDGAYGSAEYEDNYYAYTAEVQGVDDAGNVTMLSDDYRLVPCAPADGQTKHLTLSDPAHTLLVVVAKKASA